MKYLDKSFSSPANNKKYSDNYDKVFKKTKKMSKTLLRLHERLLDTVAYDAQDGTVTVKFDDGNSATTTLLDLKVPNKQVAYVALGEFRQSLDFYMADGSVHDVAADFITYLTNNDYREFYKK